MWWSRKLQKNVSVSRETVVSALNRIDVQDPEVAARPLDLGELHAAADALLARYRVAGTRTFDLTGLQRELLELLFSHRLSGASAAVVLARVLGPVPIRERASLALFLVYAIREGRIATLAHGALLALRRAASFSEPDVAAPVLRRLDAELSRREGALARHGEVLLAADRLSGERLEGLRARLAAPKAGELRQVLLVVPEEERAVDEEVLLEHLKLQARFAGDESLPAQLDAVLAARACRFVDAVTLQAPARAPRWARAQQALRTVGRALASALQPFAPVELVARGG